MSIEVITMLGMTVTILVAMASGFGWLVSRMDARFATQDDRIDARLAAVDERLDRVDHRLDRVDDRLAGVEHELTDVKIAIARLEGPPRHLLSAR